MSRFVHLCGGVAIALAASLPASLTARAAPAENGAQASEDVESVHATGVPWGPLSVAHLHEPPDEPPAESPASVDEPAPVDVTTPGDDDAPPDDDGDENVDRELLQAEPVVQPAVTPKEPNVPAQVETKADEGVPFAIMSPRRRFRSEAHRRRYMKRHATKPGATPLFARDPVTDGTVIGVSLGFAFLLEAVIFTGELAPLPPRDTDRLLPIDRLVAEADRPMPGANAASGAMLGAAGAYAIVDSVLTGRREGRTHGWTDFMLYGEAVAVNFALADLAKLAVRRPRPIAYSELRNDGAVSDETGRNMSFYSLHAAATASLSATATYLAFLRNRNPWQKWVTLGVGLGLTAGVSTTRVLSLNHFPTDVIAGALIGTGFGVLIPHLHRIDRGRRLRVVPMSDGQARVQGMSVTGLF